MREKILSELTKLCQRYSIISEEERCLEPGKGLQDYGFNSVDFLKLIAGIEEMYGFDFEDEDLVAERFQSINDLVDYILVRV